MKLGLNPQQKLAVQADDKPLLIVAGAGTGKTRTLTGRLAYLIEHGVRPDRILALTFTNKAAREMADRVFGIGKKPSDGPFIGTFHSLGARMLRVEAKLLGRNSNFVIFDDSDSMQIIRKLVKTETLDRKDDDYASAADVYRQISRIKNGVISERSALNDYPDGEFTVKIFRKYEKELEKNNAFDFDDLIEKVAEVLEKNPAVLEKYRKRFHHILVDEYQDLNNRQYELIKLLVGNSPRISVVGDDQQMIYSFRGSNFRIFLDFEKDWPDANVVLLEENYRSTGNIIRAASAVISNNIDQKPKTLWTKEENGAPVKIIEAPDEESEAEWISSEIEKMKNSDKSAEIAILYRTNAQSRAIEQGLIEKGIIYRIFGGLRFYERKEIKDIVAALRYAQNPKDEVSRERLEKNIAKGRFAKFRDSLYGDEVSVSPTEVIQGFLESTDYLDIVGRNFLNADERRENIAELLHFASEFGDLPTFLEQIALLQPMDAASVKETSGEKNGGNDSKETPVNLMTIHLAKGLEFDRVFVAGCNEGLIPHGRALGTQEEIEEERRMMYVAMTRARKELFISFYDIPSRFLGEIPRELAEFENISSDSGGSYDLDDEERYITFD